MTEECPKKRICLLGSTGSIGTQALQVIAEHPAMLEAYVLTAHTQADLLIAQARQHMPAAVVIVDEAKYEYVRDALAHLPIQVYAGADALCQVVQMEPVDMVLSALVGFAGLLPTLAAIEAGKAIALANKETLVVAGELVTARCLERHVPLLPVDSEHSAIFQCLMGESSAIEQIILTASGGPFRSHTIEEMRHVTPAMALSHPNWEMGAKITIDSATMMNKGFELIEACWLFGVSPSKVKVVVHPQSVVHSAVQFADGAVMAQMGCPDMRLPIQLAFTYPHRVASTCPRLDWWQMGALTFEAPDLQRFPCLQLACQAMEMGGVAPCVLNAANEVANLAFRREQCGFLQIGEIIEQTLGRMPQIEAPTLADYIQCDALARRVATDILQNGLG